MAGRRGKDGRKRLHLGWSLGEAFFVGRGRKEGRKEGREEGMKGGRNEGMRDKETR
jgi:hypothetical protein